uniref:Phospholipase A2-like central domain-containing protein n=1 Tax=Chelydra serpentina TaxID=8475 RepID=A0A8C3T4S0_CHESE
MTIRPQKAQKPGGKKKKKKKNPKGGRGSCLIIFGCSGLAILQGLSHACSCIMPPIEINILKSMGATYVYTRENIFQHFYYAFGLDNITFFNGVFQNVDSVALFFDCLGSHFTWLQSIFTNFPALLHFVNKMRCVTGLCPRDFEDYGCSCRFEMEGLPVDEADSCCFQHRKCYEEAVELECSWDPAKISMDISCLTKNITCESGDPCERLLCNCDKAAIECFVNSHVNSSLNGLDVSFCPAQVTGNNKGPDLLTIQVNGNLSIGRKGTKLDPKRIQEGELGSTDRLDSLCAPRPNTLSLTCLISTWQSPGTSSGSGSLYSVVALKDMVSAQEIVQCQILLNEMSLFTVCDRFTFLQMRGNGKVKRELPRLGEMLYCLTDRCPQEFESYGCYCGQEGRGYPTDVLDRCCFSHQCCMEQVKKLGCQSEGSLRSEVVCLDHKPKCIGWSMCEKLLCTCDKTAAECMAAASFNESLRFLTRQACQENKASCRSGIAERPAGAAGVGTRTSSSEESSEEAGPWTSALRRIKRATRHPQGKVRGCGGRR